MSLEIDVPEPFRELFAPTKPWRHLLYYGGRASGKSTQVALSRLLSGMERKERGLCTRELQNSIKQSVHQLLADLIDKYQLTDWQVQKEQIFNTKTGSKIIFMGLHNNPSAVKSTEGLDWAWVEEAQSVSEDSIRTLIPTIRKPGSKIIWTMNRTTEQDPAWVEVAEHPDERTYIRKVNSDEIEALLSEEIIKDREKMRKDNLELFTHVWLGEPLTANTGSVFGKQLALAREQNRVGHFPYDGAYPVYTVWDLGIGDATAIWFFQVVDGQLRFIDYYENSGEDLNHYISLLRSKSYNYATMFLPHDAEQRELQTGKTRVQFFQENGFNDVLVLRKTNYTIGEDDINMLARPKFSICYFNEDKCARGLQCLRAWHFEYDEKNRILRSKPKHDWSSHAASAFIYALIAFAEHIGIKNAAAVRFKTYTPSAFRKD